MADAEKTIAGSVLSELLHAIERAGAYNPDDQVAPAAILWTDKERQWEALVPRLRAALPQFLTLGNYDPAARTGPAIWIKCMVARTLPEAKWPLGTVPMVYLPGVSRHELRAVEDCPREIAPLAELPFRGVWFTQDNTRDWTIPAFLASKRGGLELDVASDPATRDSVVHALAKLADTPVGELRGKRLEAADFYALLQPDPVKQLLRWMDAPSVARKSWTPEEWKAFVAACQDRFGLDPERDGELVAAEKLGTLDGAWRTVWDRFVEAPQAYPGLAELLRRAKPRDENLFFHAECWPQCNERGEDELRQKLLEVGVLGQQVAAKEIEKIETIQGPRRAWVWAKLGQAPLAFALEALTELARATSRALVGDGAEAFAAGYAQDGWRADGAVLNALAFVTRAQDLEAVRATIRALYKPWLEAGAERFQELLRDRLPQPSDCLNKSIAEVSAGTCVLFADGLRLDAAKRLRAALEAAGLSVGENRRWVAVPSVTPTAKPVSSPVAHLIAGDGGVEEEFRPAVRQSRQALTIERFRKLLAEAKIQDLRGDETGDPGGRAWTEHGEIDQRGHQEGWKLAKRMSEEVGALVDRVRRLLDAGWRAVWIVTDHGWLLLPGGLPKTEMPSYLVDSKWTRCAAVKPGAKISVPTAPWFWNPDVGIALAPGISSFREGVEYSHGGISPQECVVLDLLVRAPEPTGAPVAIDVIRWVGLRCRVRVTAVKPGWCVDLRTRAADAASSIAGGREPKSVNPAGEGALIVDNPDLEGTAATVVLLDADGRVLAKRNTTVGGEE
jgi:hypothetical protein